MTKKEIQEKLNNLPKPKYLYQRYDGNLFKYEVDDNILIDVKNANNIINLDKQIILGKISENIIDLIEIGDIVKVEGIDEVREVLQDNFYNYDCFDNDVRIIIDEYNYAKQIKECKILQVVTKEQFEKDKFEV